MLLIVFLHSQAVLETYPTYELCQEERDRIGFDMAAAYPDNPDFTIVCQYSSLSLT